MNPKAAGSKAIPTPKSGVPVDGSLLYTLRQLEKPMVPLRPPHVYLNKKETEK